MAFELSEDEFTGIEDCLSQVQMVRNLTAVVECNPQEDAPVTRTQLVAFLGSIECALSRAVRACNERQAVESALRRGHAERMADAAVSDGRLPAERREVAVNIGHLSTERLQAWLNREHVIGLAPLPPIDVPRNEAPVDIGALGAMYERLAEGARAAEAAQLDGRLPPDRADDALVIGYRDPAALNAWLGGGQVDGFAPLARPVNARRGGKAGKRQKKEVARMEAMIDAAIRAGIFPPHLRGHLTQYASFGEAELSAHIAEVAKAKEASDAGGVATHPAIDQAIRDGAFPLHLRDHLVGYEACHGVSELADYIAEATALLNGHAVDKAIADAEAAGKITPATRQVMVELGKKDLAALNAVIAAMSGVQT